MTDATAGATDAQTAPETGYVPVNGMQMYYEIHGSGGIPLVLLHGGLFNIDLQFGELLPGLAAPRQVIATDFQAARMRTRTSWSPTVGASTSCSSRTSAEPYR